MAAAVVDSVSPKPAEKKKTRGEGGGGRIFFWGGMEVRLEDYWLKWMVLFLGEKGGLYI